MSAFVVGHDHIDGLLTWAIDQKVSYYWANQRIEITDKNASKIGRTLLKENERSVGHRYNETDPTEMPGTRGQYAADYIYRRFMPPIKAVSILKACDCFDYQACETDDWEQSQAWLIIHTISKFAGRRVAGYEDAPGWELKRPANPRGPRLQVQEMLRAAHEPRVINLMDALRKSRGEKS
jgi:hypothetical protein